MRSPSASPGYRSTRPHLWQEINEVGKLRNRIKVFRETVLVLAIVGTVAVAPVYLAIHVLIRIMR